MGGRKRKFSDEDIEYILKHYKEDSYEKLGTILGQNPHSIRAIYHREKNKRMFIRTATATFGDYEDVDPTVFLRLMRESVENHRKYGAICE